MARAEGLREYSFQHPRRDDDRRREYDTPLSQGQGTWHDVRWCRVVLNRENLHSEG
jgi:hypothetical protein